MLWLVGFAADWGAFIWIVLIGALVVLKLNLVLLAYRPLVLASPDRRELINTQHYISNGRTDYPSTGPIRLLLVDEQKLYREGLTTVFSRRSDIRVVGQARTGIEACEKARRVRPDVILMDTRIPEMDGVTATRAILSDLPQTRIAMLTESRSSTDLLDAVKAGARGYITKDCSIDTLVDCVQRIAHGEAVITPGLAARLLDEYTAMARRSDHESRVLELDSAKVTDRERDVLELLVQGATNRDIARQLSITENTVKVHLRNILEKLHLRNRQQAAAFAISSGLVRLYREEATPQGA